MKVKFADLLSPDSGSHVDGALPDRGGRSTRPRPPAGQSWFSSAGYVWP